MRYQNLRSFEKHLESARSDPLCRCYLVAVAEDQERGKILQSLLAPFPSATRLQAGEHSFSTLFEAWQNPSLFEGEAIFMFDGCEKLGKKEAEELSRWIESGLSGGRLFLGARGKTAVMKAVEAVGVVLDLTEEKPWEREKRFQERLSIQAEEKGKRLASDAGALLLERIGLDALALDRELEKLICFVGDRASIERSDVFRIAAESRSLTLWQMAEAMIWEEGRAAFPHSFSNLFHGLIPALRSQLHLGAILCHLMESGVPFDQWSSQLPGKIWPRTLEKRSLEAAKRGSAFYKGALDRLFKIELLSRTGSDQFEALLTLFFTSVHHASR